MNPAGLLAVLELEREPLRFENLIELSKAWLGDAGGFAALAWFIGALAFVIRRSNRPQRESLARELGIPGVIAALAGAIATVLFAVVLFIYVVAPPEPSIILDPDRPEASKRVTPVLKPIDHVRESLANVGGAAALIAIGLPFLLDAFKLRPRRVFALAKLSFKEAIRRRILWVFLGFLLLFLFPPKWFRPIKLEDEVRAYIAVVDLGMSLLMLLAFGLLSAFSLPTDLKNQTIHTIVTKPVERFEIVLGRILGFSALATLVLAALTSVSLLMLWASNVSPEAQEESYKARVPVYGDLQFRGKQDDFRGESVGYEWEYRRYIAGGPRASQRAVWAFFDNSPTALPAHLASKPEVACEFAFDIFRTTKGEEGKGVFATLAFFTGKWTDTADQQRQYQEATRGLNLNAQPGSPDWKKLDEIAEKLGYYEYRSKEIADFHTLGIILPGGLFRNALDGPPTMVQTPSGPRPMPRLQVWVKCDSRTQFLGMAKRDLYLLEGETPFAINFYKATVGLWLRLVLVIATSVVLSTYLSGVVSWLAAMFLYGAGFFRPFIIGLAEGTSVGGGPTESLVRLLGNKNITAPLEKTASSQIATFFDSGFRVLFRRMLNIIPDVEKYDWSAYIAEGFNVSGAELLVNGLVLLGYLLPWLVLGYYIMKSREVAA